MATETVNKIVRQDVLESALTQVREKVYNRTEPDNKISEAIDAIPAYTLPVASKTVLGGVKVGAGLSVDEQGVISASEIDLSEFQTAAQVKAIADASASAAKAELIGGAPETYDTLKEIADYIAEHSSVETALNAAIGKKADKTALDSLSASMDGKADKTALDGVEAKIDALQYMTAAEAVGMVNSIFE